MKADLHIHTNFSPDGVSSPKEVVQAALEKNIDCICITDHHEIKGAIEAMRLGHDKNILVIPGIEILSRSGDVLGINVKKIIPDGLSLEKTIEEIKKQGGFAVIPHPFDRLSGGFWGGEKKLLQAGADAIEVFNASLFSERSNKKAFNFAEKNNLCFTAGSDAHRAKFVGRGYLNFSKNISSAKELIEEIRNKTAEIQGDSFSFMEGVKNSSGVDVRRIVDYCRYRIKKR